MLISEVRSPYIPADLFGLIHGRCRPNLRIAHLHPGETENEARDAMRLIPGVVAPGATGGVGPGWPTVLGGYRIDEWMEPVLFWTDPEALACKIAVRLGRIRQPRKDLDDSAKARAYFLKPGRILGGCS